MRIPTLKEVVRRRLNNVIIGYNPILLQDMGQKEERSQDFYELGSRSEVPFNEQLIKEEEAWMDQEEG